MKASRPVFPVSLASCHPPLQQIRFHSEDVMSASKQELILVVDDNSIFRETLADRLRASGHDVLVAETGEQAFLTLRDRSHSIGWLYTRAALPGLIDGGSWRMSITTLTQTAQS